MDLSDEFKECWSGFGLDPVSLCLGLSLGLVRS